MNKVHVGNVYSKMISASCLLVLSCILIAGLWPFHPPRNAVSWLKNENGLRFGGHSSVVSTSAFRAASSAKAGYSLEIWLTPARITGGGSILAFDSSADPRAPFLLRQYGTSLAVQHYLVDEQGHVTQPWFKVDHLLRAGKRVFVTITANNSQTDLYLDGVLTAESSDAGITGRELTGRLLLANSTGDDSWVGQIEGLAIYGRELTQVEVKNHLQSWMLDHNRLLASEKSPIALYVFDERGGTTVRNLVDPATNLTIPASYFVLHPVFLRSFWDQYRHTRGILKRWSFWQDLLVNIGGFVPVGFVFLAYFSSVKPTRRAGVIVVLLGFFLSFTIEAWQWFLPTRDSGMTDLITNTIGTALGVLLYRSSIGRMLLNFMVPAREDQAQLASQERRSPMQEQRPTISA
jgi:hypothetical protein